MTKWKEIERDALEMCKMPVLQKKTTESMGKWKEAFAIHHSQVSEKPYNFFVLHNFFVVSGLFPNQIVINPEILEKSEPKTLKEGCMSFPFREAIKIKRYDSVKVKFQMRTGKLIKRFKMYETTYHDLLAQIFLHETGHTKGNFIYK